MATQNQLPKTLAKLSDYTRLHVLLNEWDEFKGPAMEPALEDLVEGANWLGPDGIALRRLYELSPEEARPVILNLLKTPAPDRNMEPMPGYGDREGVIETLGMLPDKELPELDSIMVQRLLSSQDDGALEISAGLLQRYSSAAIAGHLQPWFDERIGKIGCGAEANLLAYFLRIDAQNGVEMLRKVMQTGLPGCLPLQRLAQIRMSPEVEQEALNALDDTRPAVVEEALGVLQSYGSFATRESLRQHFREWHATWEKHAADLDMPGGSDQQRVELAYVDALGAAQAWLTSKEDLQRIGELCISNSCREHVEQIRNSWGSTWSYPMIEIWEAGTPGRDEFTEGVSLGPGPATMERLKEKMMQFPQGSVFTLDARYKEKPVIQRIYNELEPWAAEHGFKLQSD